MKIVKEFAEINKSDTLIAGGKGASLGEMTQSNIPVPPGFVILSNAFDLFIKNTDLHIEIDAALDEVNVEAIHTIDRASKKIQAMINSKEIPQNIADEIIKSFKTLDAECVAVRSSATAEDSSAAAWAGQLDTFLNTTEDTLLNNVKKCWASLFTPRAIFYRFEKKLHKDTISVAVVVQEMIQSETSGVAFSVHPVTEDLNQIVIEASFGLGEAIVSGQVTPDNYVVKKKPREIIEKNVSIQTKELCCATGGGNEWRNIPKEKGEKQVLIDEEIIELTQVILNIEKQYGFHVDIEWARQKNKFFILQSRPITTLSKTSKVDSKGI